MEKPNKPRVGLRDILKSFWTGIKHHKLGFYTSLGLYAIGAVFDLIPPLFYKRFFDTLSYATNKEAVSPTLVHIILMILGVNLMVWVTYRSGQFIINAFEAGVMSRLRESSFEYLIDHSYSFFSNNFSGALVQKVNRFVRSFEKLFDSLVYNFIPLIITIVGVIYVVWKQEPKIAIVLLVWSVVVMLVNYCFSIWKLKYDVRSAASDSKSVAYLADSITNQNTVAVFSASAFESEGFKKVSQEQRKATKLTWDISTLMNAVQNLLIIFIEFALFYFAVKLWIKDAITVGTFVLIQVYILGLAMKLWSFSSLIRGVYEGVADSKEMAEILQTPHEIRDLPGAQPISVTRGKIEFKNIVFSFNPSRKVVNDINLTVNAGEKVGLIGPSGAGKSTVVKLLLRMYDIQEGEILVDGQNITQVTQESLRKNISLVPQDPVLFHRTLMENIRYGRLDATDEEVIEAAKLAHCDEFIDSLPEKYNTFVGERGIKLSGGERQRVAIARAILKNAPILILDEATSSLDSHSEALIQDALDKLMKNKTSIVIAHRLSTIRMMDRIIVIEKGKVIEEGTHDELLSRKESLYKNLWSLQAGGFILEELDSSPSSSSEER